MKRTTRGQTMSKRRCSARCGLQDGHQGAHIDLIETSVEFAPDADIEAAREEGRMEERAWWVEKVRGLIDIGEVRERWSREPGAIVEQLADYAHQSWSGWMEYLFSKCVRDGELYHADHSLEIPSWAVERWKRQVATPYSELPEDEKESDRAEAEKMLSIFRGEHREGEG